MNLLIDEFNASYGYFDGNVRSLQPNLIKSAQYSSLTQCESIEDLKQFLTSQRLCEFKALDVKITPALISRNLLVKLVAQFTYLVSDLDPSSTAGQFVAFTRHGYMIDNAMRLVQYVLRESAMSEFKNENDGIDENKESAILAGCHPLGLFDSLPAILASNPTIMDIYDTVLVESPLAGYFAEAVAILETLGNLTDQTNEIYAIILTCELLRSAMHKAHLESWNAFIQYSPALNSTTKATMQALLNIEADKRSFGIAVDSVLAGGMSAETKFALMPKVGLLVESGLIIELAAASDISSISVLLSKIGEYRDLAQALQSLTPTLTTNAAEAGDTGEWNRRWSVKEMEACKAALEQPFNLSTIYALMKIREQECANITWIAECIVQNRKDQAIRIVPTLH